MVCLGYTLTSDQESDHVVDDRIVTKFLTTLGIHVVDHGVQKIFLVAWMFSPVIEKLLCSILHDIYVKFVGFILLSVQEASHGGTPGSSEGL